MPALEEKGEKANALCYESVPALEINITHATQNKSTAPCIAMSAHKYLYEYRYLVRSISTLLLLPLRLWGYFATPPLVLVLRILVPRMLIKPPQVPFGAIVYKNYIALPPALLQAMHGILMKLDMSSRLPAGVQFAN
jgi:hypothetical protein